MTNLTENQQNLIAKITEEFMRQNKTKTLSKSLLDVAEIIDAVDRKQKEIERVKRFNNIVAEEMWLEAMDNFDLLLSELTQLGLDAEFLTEDWTRCYDGRLLNTIRIKGNKDSHITIDLEVVGPYVKFENAYLPNSLRQLEPVIYYNKLPFETFCKSVEFRSYLKSLYEKNK